MGRKGSRPEPKPPPARREGVRHRTVADWSAPKRRRWASATVKLRPRRLRPAAPRASSSALRAPAAVLAACCLLVAIAMSSDDRNAYYYLGADLGGTNFRVALYKTSRAGEDPAAPIFTHHYRNLDHGGVEEMLADFLHQFCGRIWTRRRTRLTYARLPT